MRASALGHAAVLLALAVLAACSPLEPDPVIRDGIDVGPIQSFEADRVSGPGIWSIYDPAASDNHALGFYSDGTVTVPLELVNAVSGFVVRARGDECKGWPELVMAVDKRVVLKTEVKTSHWTDYPTSVELGPGMHHFDITFTNNHFEGGSCDRNLFVDKVTFLNVGGLNHGRLRATSMLLPDGVLAVDDPRSPNRKVVAFMSDALVTGQTRLEQPAAGLSISVRGDLCKGAPNLDVTTDGANRGTFPVTSTTWTNVWVPAELPVGIHTISLAFNNDHYEPGACDRNLYVDTITPLAQAPAIPQVSVPAFSHP